METLERILGEQPFFAGLSPEFLRLATGCANNVRFEAGEFICKEADPADRFYLVRHGQVALQLFAPGRGAMTFQTVGPGEMFGMSWIAPPYKWTYDARALELTRALAVDGLCLRDKCDHDHDLGYELMQRFLSRTIESLHATRLQLLDVYGAKV